MRTVDTILIVLLGLLVIGWTGLQIKPKSFAAFPGETPTFETVPMPEGLPTPVERFYRTVYGDRIPVIKTVVIKGRAIIRPVMNVPLPARFVFIHETGRNYRHYIEAGIFGLPILKVNEGYIDGKSFFEAPVGTYRDDPHTNQGANLALWAEATWFPTIWVTDGRVRWEPVDDTTALLFVPFEDKTEDFVVRFDPVTNLLVSMEAMRYRDPGEGKPKILWITRTEAGGFLPGTKLSAVGSATWLDQGRPWAVFTLEEVKYNVDVSQYIRRRGE
jgi:hypothetical protein